MILSDKEKEILEVICYFDVLERPVTILEIKTRLKSDYSLAEILSSVAENNLSQLIQDQDGYYFLAGREELMRIRHERYIISVGKLRRAAKIIFFLKYLPWVRGILAYSSLSFFNANSDSDIDLFFIAEERRLWSARFFLNTFLKFFRLRPTSKTAKDKICASYLADQEHLDLSVANSGPTDYWYQYGVAQFTPLFSQGKAVEIFFEANSWLKRLFPAWRPKQSVGEQKLAHSQFKNLLEIIGGCFTDKFYQKLQLAILPAKYREIMNSDTRVIIKDGMIKLHQSDRGRRYNQLFLDKYQQTLNYANSLGEN